MLNPKEYMQEYNKKYKTKKKAGKPPKFYNTIEDKYLIDMHINTPLVIHPTGINFSGTDRDEPVICSQFGCANPLSDEQKLYGSKCIHHQSKNKIDPTNFVSYQKTSA